MIPHVTKGDRMAGLLAYLVGPGKRNEHEDPHLVAGDPAVMTWHDDNELSRDAALRVARHLDQPKRALGTPTPQGHVWHCSLSLRADEGQLEDEKWRAIAERFVDDMGFGGSDGSPCRWVAVRHGVSTNGNDHIHVVVNLVREDGTRASTHRDFQRAQTVARRLESEFGLTELDSTAERASRGFHPAEAEADARRRVRGRFERRRRDGEETRSWEQVPAAEKQAWTRTLVAEDQPRVRLEREVRAAAGTSLDEAEFVRRLRQRGVLVRARFAEGTQDVVAGYSVARKPVDGERPLWFGGGRLARDLTLPRLREVWPDTPQGASAAAAEWNAARRGRRPVSPGREVRTPGPDVWKQVRDNVADLRRQLAAAAHADPIIWEGVARETAAGFAAWSARVEPVPGPLADAARTLGVSASTKRTLRPRGSVRRSVAGDVATALSAASTGKSGALAQAAMMRLLLGLARDLHGARVARAAAWDAARIEHMARQELREVIARLPMDDPATMAATGGASKTPADRPRPAVQGPPIPGRLPPAGSRRPGQPVTPTHPGRGEGGFER